MRLIAEGLRHRYSPASPWVLDDVNMSVRAGQVVAIVGPSGSGKTTLLALLGGLLPVQAGSVSVLDDTDTDTDTDTDADTDADADSDTDGTGSGIGGSNNRRHGTRHPAAEQVAWVLQTVNVMADRSVVDNVCLGAYSAGARREEAEAIANRWLARVGLDDRGAEPVRVLSGGEVQRVVIARALASQRPMLLADEPTGQLDAATTDSVLSVLFDRSHGRGVVVVTHDPAVAARCDRVLRLRDGTLHPEPSEGEEPDEPVRSRRKPAAPDPHELNPDTPEAREPNDSGRTGEPG